MMHWRLTCSVAALLRITSAAPAASIAAHESLLQAPTPSPPWEDTKPVLVSSNCPIDIIDQGDSWLISRGFNGYGSNEQAEITIGDGKVEIETRTEADHDVLAVGIFGDLYSGRATSTVFVGGGGTDILISWSSDYNGEDEGWQITYTPGDPLDGFADAILAVLGTVGAIVAGVCCCGCVCLCICCYVMARATTEGSRAPAGSAPPGAPYAQPQPYQQQGFQMQQQPYQQQGFQQPMNQP